MALKFTWEEVKNVRCFISRHHDFFIVLLLVFTVLPLCYWLYSASGPHFIAFNSQQWKNVKTFSEDYTRNKMVDFLMNNYQLTGISESKLLDLLGPPSLDSSVSKKYFRDWDIVYWIGVSAGGENTCQKNIWLAFKNNNHVVSQYQVIWKYCSYDKFK